MKTGILLFEQMHGKKDIGSSMLRGHWIAKHWKEVGADIGDCEVFQFGVKYDAIIFQKAYFPEYAKAFTGVKILDICDPDFLEWPTRTVEMIEEVDAITCSSLALQTALQAFTKKPVYYIPDRVDFSIMPAPRTHEGRAKSVVWFGYSHNFQMLNSAVKSISDRGLELFVVSNDVYVVPTTLKANIVNLPWSPHYMEDIQKGDICINPQYTGGKWKYKSSNKSHISRALGVPVAHTIEELDALLEEEPRKAAAEAGYKETVEKFNILTSIFEFKNIINEIAAKKTTTS